MYILWLINYELLTDISGNVVDVGHRHADAARVHRGVEMVVLLPGRGRRSPTHLEDMFPPSCGTECTTLRYTAKSLSPD